MRACEWDSCVLWPVQLLLSTFVRPSVCLSVFPSAGHRETKLSTSICCYGTTPLVQSEREEEREREIEREKERERERERVSDLFSRWSVCPSIDDVLNNERRTFAQCPLASQPDHVIEINRFDWSDFFSDGLWWISASFGLWKNWKHIKAESVFYIN